MLAETIRVGEMTGGRVEISHLKVDSPNRWGNSGKALAMIDAARGEGDRHAGRPVRLHRRELRAGHPLSLVGPRGRPSKIAERLNTPVTWDKIKQEMAALLAERGLRDLSFAIVAMYRPDASFHGQSMQQIAQRVKGSDSADAQFEAARDMLLQGGAQMVYHFMSDEDVDRIMRHPQVAIASDSGVLAFGDGVPHPRGYGDNARVLGTYVRTRHVIGLEEAIRKMTSLPAAHFKLANRGLVKTGYAADLVVFDPKTVAEPRPSTHRTPMRRASPTSSWNGVVVVRNGTETDARPGQVIANSCSRSGDDLRRPLGRPLRFRRTVTIKPSPPIKIARTQSM